MKKNKTASLLIWQIFFLLLFASLFPSPLWAQSSPLLSVIEEVAGGEKSLFGKKFALVIGVGDYEADWQDLPAISEDIQSVKDILEDLGFTVFTVENPSSMLLEDAFNTFINQYGQDKNARLLNLLFRSWAHNEIQWKRNRLYRSCGYPLACFRQRRFSFKSIIFISNRKIC